MLFYIVDYNFDIKQGLVEQNQFGTSEAWSTDELYSIQKGYTGAYLKITLPVGSEHANKYILLC